MSNATSEDQSQSKNHHGWLDETTFYSGETRLRYMIERGDEGFYLITEDLEGGRYLAKAKDPKIPQEVKEKLETLVKETREKDF